MDNIGIWELIDKIGRVRDNVLDFTVGIDRFINNISENYDSIVRILEDFKDKKKINIYFATILLDKKIGLNDIFISKNFCVPIFYYLEKGTLGEAFKEEKYDPNTTKVEEIMNSIEVKKYYLKQMDKWIDEEIDEYMRNFIKEIKFNFENDNIYCTTLNLFTLIEYKISQVKKQNINLIKKRSNKELITETIRNVLKENCFNYKNESKLIEIYNKFLDNKSGVDLYKDTKKNPNSITRHMLHGERLDLITKNSMMSLIFFTDCICKMLFIDKKNM